MRRVPTRRVATVALAVAAAISACGGDSANGPVTLTLVAYDSFPEKDTPLNDALAAFTVDTGIAVRLAIAGDAGQMLAKAVTTAGNPEGDVMFGVDNTFLSRAVDGKVFDPYMARGIDAIPRALTAGIPDHIVTPVDTGAVCVNYDKAWFADKQLDPPASLEALADPAYRDLLVVENPATSSPGLAFLLATVARFGDDGWRDYWQHLRANGVEVVDGWEAAYSERFSGSSGEGPKPLVVSYGSSPPAEVLFSDTPLDDAPTGVVESTCFRQVEYAGVLRGTDHPREARRLVDFLISDAVQRALPLTLFVYPARQDTALPDEFAKYAVVPSSPITMAPERIAAGRQRWIDEWTTAVLR